jgi:exonuclease VII large subunit
MQFLEERESYVERYVDNWESKMKELSRWAQKKIEEQARHVKTLSEFRSNTEKARIIQEREADVEIYVENLKEKVDAISEYTKEKIEEQGRHIQTLSELHRELVKKSCCVFVWPPCGNQEYTLSAGLNDKRNEFFEDLITKFHSENMRLLEEREANAERYIQTLSEFRRILGKGE